MKTHNHREYKVRTTHPEKKQWLVKVSGTFATTLLNMCVHNERNDSSFLLCMTVQYVSVCFLSKHAVWAVISGICHTAALPRAWLRFTTRSVCVCVPTWTCVRSRSSVITHFYIHGDLPVCAPCHPRGDVDYQQPFILSCLSWQLIWWWRSKFYFLYRAVRPSALIGFCNLDSPHPHCPCIHATKLK